MTTYKYGKPIHTVQTYKSAEAKKYETVAMKIIKQAMKDQKWETPPKEKYVIVNATFYFSRINQDDNNYYKVPLDVIEGAGAIFNDCKVMIRTNDIFIESKNPRVEIELVVSEKIGIFKDENELEKFKNENCLMCIKDKSKCSILKKCLENKINSEELVKNTLNCLKKKSKTTQNLTKNG